MVDCSKVESKCKPRNAVASTQVRDTSLSSQYVVCSLHDEQRVGRTTRTLCNCGDRFGCPRCRKVWISRRTQSNQTWLSAALGPEGLEFTALLTIPTDNDPIAEECELHRRWRRLSMNRSQQHFRNSGDLLPVRRAIAVIHWVNKHLEYSPHLHAVFITDLSTSIRDSLNNAWSALGPGFADCQSTITLEGSIRYAIAGDLPDDPTEQKALSRLYHGKHLVKRMGK